MVRQATLSDIETLVRLMQQYAREQGEAFGEATARALETLLDDARLGQVWVIEDGDGHAAGFVVVTVAFNMECGGLRGFIDDFYVAPPYRRRGFGHAALAEVKRACRQRGVRALFVETRPDNEAAASAYRSVGFTDSGQSLLSLSLTD